MRKHLLILAFCSASVAVAQPTRTTQANGNALNPLTWDCFCIPALTDNIVVNHALNLDIDYYATSGSLTINSTGSITGSTPTRIIAVAGSTFTNNGTVSVGYVYHSAGAFNNNGTLTATNHMGVDNNAVCNNYGTLNVNDTLGIDTTAQLHNHGYMAVLVTLNAGLYMNHLGYTGQDFWSTGTVDNMGGAGMSVASLYSNGTFTNTSLLNVNGSLYNSNNFTNSHQIVVDMNLLNGDTLFGTATFTNNSGGIISVGNDLLNSEDINGNGGKFCVQNQTSNSGAIAGTIDICDLTGGNIDLNVGTVAGTVTFCSNSCSIGVTENQLQVVQVYPNPFEDYIRIETGVTENIQCWLHDAQGRLVAQTLFSGQGILEIPQAQSGVYMLTVRFSNGAEQHSVLVK